MNASLKLEKVAAGVVGVLILCVLPATMSRSAWVAAVIGCAWVIYMHRDSVNGIYYGEGIKTIYLLWDEDYFVLIVGGAGAFFLKPDSALGRLFYGK